VTKIFRRLAGIGQKDAISIAYRVFPSLFVIGLYLRSRPNPYWAGGTWALVLCLSYVGWGSLVAWLVAPRRRVDLGLRAAWGVAATLGVGGIAAMFHVASNPFLIAQIALGCAFAVFGRAIDRDRLPSMRSVAATATRLGPYLVVAFCGLGVLFEWLGQLGTTPSNVSDDQALYFFLPEKLLQTGSLLDPFDVRRITSYGGQFYLHAQFLVAGGTYQLNVVDCGIGTLLVFLHIVGRIAPRSLRRADASQLVVLLLLLTLFQVRFNIGSLLTGVAMGLGTYRTLLWLDEDGDASTTPKGRVALLALCTVATCLLRTSNAIAIVPLVGLALLSRPALGRRRLDRTSAAEGLRDALWVGGLFVLWILPWLVMFHESVGTFVYPLGRGNITPGFELLKAETGVAYNLKHVLADLGHDRPLLPSLLLLLAGLAPVAPAAARRRTWLPLAVVVCVLALTYLSYAGGAFDASVDSRYYFAFLMWTAIAVATSVRSSPKLSWAATSRGALVLAAVVVHVAYAHDEMRKRLDADVDAYDAATTNPVLDAQKDTYKTEEYRDVQYHLPRGAIIGVTVADPFRLDMKRNVIFSLDQPGGMGPDGGFPVFRGPEVFAEYLLKHGMRYLIAMDYHTGNDLYDLGHWRGHMRLEHSFLAYEAPIQVDAMQSIETLEKSRLVVYHQFNMFAIDLATRVN